MSAVVLRRADHLLEEQLQPVRLLRSRHLLHADGHDLDGRRRVTLQCTARVACAAHTAHAPNRVIHRGTAGICLGTVLDFTSVKNTTLVIHVDTTAACPQMLVSGLLEH